MRLFNRIGSMKKIVIMAIMTVVGFVMPNAKAQTPTPTLGSDSVYTITQGSASDYTYKTGYGDNVQYYKVNLNPANMSTSSSIQWRELPNSTGSNLMLSLPHNGDTSNPEIKYFAYTYTMPSGYTETNQRVENPTADQVNNKLFQGASIVMADGYVYGGAIYNNSLTENIIADFVGNYANGTSGSIYDRVYGGAIYNGDAGTIENITGDFVGNYANAISGHAYGGAISNVGTITTITGDFVGNYANTTGIYANGGAIDNGDAGTIENITGDFVGNYAQSESYSAGGGAIDNDYEGTITTLTGVFVGNYAQSTNSSAGGGAISNSGTIDSITGDFVGNYANATSGSAKGGAIGNSDTITTITGDFVGNYANATSDSAKGGAINIFWATIDSITGDFVGNYAQSESDYAYGGVIYNYEGTIGSITGDFVGNYAQSESDYAYGGAIYNYTNCTIGTITGDFVGNYVQSTNSSAYGGAIYNYTNCTIGTIIGDFVGNYAESGGAIYNAHKASIGSITGDFVGNYAQGTYASAGAIYNALKASIGSITGDFVRNYTNSTGSYDSARGGAINNVGTITTITGDFVGNYAVSTGTYGSAEGGAIFGGTIDRITGDFVGNYAQSELYSAYGGAIYTSKDLNFVADNRTNTFSGNYIQVGDGEKQYEAIYVNSDSATLTFNATNGGKFVMDDYTNGVTGYNVKLTGDGTGTFELNNQLKEADVTTENITVDLANDKLDNYTFNSLTSSADTKYELDVDFLNKTSDTITTTNASTGVVTVTGLNILNDLSQLTGDYKIKVLNTQDSNLQLALSNEIQSQLATYGEIVLDKSLMNSKNEAVRQVTNWNDTYNVSGQYNYTYGSMGLATTTTTNDSIGVSVSRTELGDWENAGVVADILAYVNKNSGGFESREFNFSGADNVYTVKENLGNTAGKLTINGVADGENKSTIDMNSHSGFVLNSGANLNLSNIVLENANGKALTLNSGATASIENVTFKNNGNTTGNNTAYGAIYNTGTILNGITGSFVNNYASSTTDARGGAIYNTSTIGNIEADFNRNWSQGSSNFSWAGAIFNTGKIGNITGDFIGNYAKSESGRTYGGAIYNNGGTITSITGDFIGNYAQGTYAEGGAIYNGLHSTITSITGDFIGNYAISSSSFVYGGAIYNRGTIDSITGDFVGNYAQGSSASGGAIRNYHNSSIGAITGDFVGNYAQTTNRSVYGGAIYNIGTITTITGDFVGNYAQSESDSALGGAIDNGLTIGSITGDFVGNYAQSTNSYAYGGAIYNGLTIGSITGDFVGNYAQGNSKAYGGAIYNYSSRTITSITGDFVGNYAQGSSAYGGAIYNDTNCTITTITTITGDFVGNYAQGSSASGGAIYNRGTIDSITGDFVGNYAQGSSASGGAIRNYDNSSIGAITGDFVGNYAQGSDASGGAIDNFDIIGSITGDFVGNYAQSTNSDASGGAIDNSGGTIGEITGSFLNNYASSTNSYARGGAIYNSGTITTITGDFVGNYAQGTYAEGGAIDNGGGTIDSITGDFVGNYAQGTYAEGGAIDNGGGTIDSITGDFVGNYAQSTNRSAYGGAIYNYYGTITTITGDFVGNYAQTTNRSAYGGAIYNGTNCTITTITTITGDFVGNYAQSESDSASGGAIYNLGKVGKLINSSFVGNWAEAKTGTALGGAIYTTTNLNLFADGKDVQIRDNYTMSNGVKDDNAIYVDNSSATLTFNIKNNGSILLKDNIDGVTGYNFNVTGDNTGVFYLQNDIRNANVSMGGITLNTINNMVYNNHFNSFTLTDSINMAVDVDLARGTMDRISADNYGTHNGSLNVIGMNLLSDMADDVNSMDIVFADAGLKGAVTFGAGELPHKEFQTSIYTPIYKYNVRYDERDDMGYFNFAKGDKIILPNGNVGGSTGNSSDAFNPAVLGGSTSATVGAVGTMNQAVHYSFNSVDAYMNIPYMERMAMKRRNHYALAGTPDDVRQLGRYSPLYLPGDEEESVWVKPYTTFESVPLKNGPKVSNISYGTLVGFDSQMKSLRHGWDRVISGYVGYTGASQRYSGVDATQNGGLLGGTLTLYRGNFFNATTLNVGSSVSQNETMYGKDDYTMLMSGIANKTGYNLEFKDGKVILQPSMLVGYTFVNTFDYTNAAGVKIDNKPLHTIQVSPGVKVIGNLKNGWQPYASVNMVWNLMGEYDATANGVKLPEMKVKPYVQYGVGLQKRIKDHFMAYGQAMLHNGGRNGISLTAGFRWALGHKDNCDYETPEIKAEIKNTKVKAEKKVSKTIKQENSKKVLKELSQEQQLQIEADKKNSFKLRKNVVSAK